LPDRPKFLAARDSDLVTPVGGVLIENTPRQAVFDATLGEFFEDTHGAETFANAAGSVHFGKTLIAL
jgi:hypothetical protein